MKNLQYRFYKNEIGTPQFDIEPPFEGLSELGSCKNIEEIVISLSQLIKNKIEKFDFGYEVYVLECTSKECKVIDTFDNWKTVVEIPTQEVYELMRDWRDYLIKYL